MDLIQKINKLGYKHYTEFTILELDKLPLNNPNKQIEYFFIQKWLREVHKIDIVIGSNVLGYHVLLYERNTGKTINVSPVNLTQFYEEALEIGLLTALKLIN